MLKILTTAEELHCRTPFVKQFFAVHLLLGHLSMADSIKLGECNLVDLKLIFDLYAIFIDC